MIFHNMGDMPENVEQRNYYVCHRIYIRYRANIVNLKKIDIVYTLINIRQDFLVSVERDY